jgi:hypothetical protein
MPTAWPGTLPQFVQSSGYAEDKHDQTTRSPTDSGATKVRRRFTGRFDNHSVTLAMTAAQVAIFETLHDTTLKGGSLTFTWVHPRTQAACTYKFISTPKITHVDGDQYRVSFKLELQP